MDILLIFLHLSTFTLIVTGNTLQSSTYNQGTPSLALDDDVTSCAETGFERGAWWAKVYDDPINVSAVEVLGSASAIQVRVGDTMTTIGSQGGFGSNELCVFDDKLSSGTSYMYRCPNALEGRIVSIQAVDPTSSEQLKLCDVIMHTI